MRLLLLGILLLCSYSTDGRRTRQIWKKKTISWKFSDPYGLIKSETTVNLIRSLLNASFSLWENALDRRLRIVEATSERSDIDIHFARKKHGHKQALDGPGGMVAHSGLPPRGYLHLDADEKWSFDGGTGIDLRYVILHETGHLLGLRHLWHRNSIMNSFYRELKNGMSLSAVDINAIKHLYKDKYLKV